MKAVACQEPGRLELIDAPEPSPGAGEALVRPRRIGICGTDLHAFGGRQPYFQYPRILGHELCVEVLEAPPGSAVQAGQLAAILPYLSCGACLACRRGRTNCCASLQVIGVHCDGGMRERFAVPADLLIPADGLTEDQMAVVECLAIGAHAVRRATIEPGEVAAVVGAGPIGIGVLQFARRAGARVLAIDADPARLRYCRDALGIDAADCLDASAGEVGEALAARTGGDLPTAVFDATGSPAAMEASFRLPAASGRLVLVGLVQGRLSFDDPDFHRRELTLLSSRNATRQDFESVIAAFRAGELESDQFFTHRAAFGDEMVERFPGWAARGSGVIKALVECG